MNMKAFRLRDYFGASLSTMLILWSGAFFQSASAQEARWKNLEKIRSIASMQFEKHRLNSLLLQVRIDGREAATLALGEAITGVPATVAGRFRNGAVAIAYVAALALRLSEEGVIDLDTPIAHWLPNLPASDKATIRMLANMTAGYPDHVANEEKFERPFNENPFRTWTPQELIDVSLSTRRRFAPGENWDYSHSGYVILGQVLEAATGKPMHRLMDEYILKPLKLDETSGFDIATVPEPAIHGFTAERGVWEDSTFWNPSWTLPSGAIQVTTISDMARSFDAIVGVDGFLTTRSRKAMTEPSLIGFGAPLEGCPTCRTLTRSFSYGLGAMLRGDWVFQTPLFGGYASSVGTLPQEHSRNGRITIAVAVTLTQASIQDWKGRLPNFADETVRLIASELAPDNPVPSR